MHCIYHMVRLGAIAKLSVLNISTILSKQQPCYPSMRTESSQQKKGLGVGGISSLHAPELSELNLLILL